jgi:transcription initiation factor IIE alpha subunit
MEDNSFSKEYNLKANDVRGVLNRLKEDGFLLR